MQRARKIAIPIIALLCVGAIIYLLFFFGKDAAPSSELTTIATKQYTISFDTDVMEYTVGSDFMSGVTATDTDGTDLTQYVTVSCKPTNNIHKKTLTYSINKAGYEILTFERELIIDKAYNGPSIEVKGSGVEVPLDQIKNLSAIILASDTVTTDDGFGAQCVISAAIQNQGEIVMGDYVATVTAQNIFGDTATAKITVAVTQPESSVIKLSASSVTIKKGEAFEPMEYVVGARDDEYGDVTPMVTADPIDTSKAGIYTIEYRIKGIHELENEVAYLYVTVN